MRRGATLLLGAGLVLTGGCAANTSPVEIRAIADPAAKLEHGSDRLAESRGQLVLGNIGLAIEGFHAALREQPASVQAMAGLADCYDRIGRSDLSRQYFEEALSLAPHDPAVLSAFAASLATQGKQGEALALRKEADAQLGTRQTPPAPVLAAATVTVHLQPPGVRLPAEVQLGKPKPVGAAASDQVVTKPLAATAPAQAAAAAGPGHAVTSRSTATTPVSPPLILASTGDSVTVKLPPVRTPVPAPAQGQAKPQDGPRLQRLSQGEVALLTGAEPAWLPRRQAPRAPQSSIRWVALDDRSSTSIQLLNAARLQGLAARTRNTLAGQGWRRIEIGDADRVRQHTLVLYPIDREGPGRRLALEFETKSAILRNGNRIVVLLGRDRAARRILQAQG